MSNGGFVPIFIYIYYLLSFFFFDRYLNLVLVLFIYLFIFKWECIQFISYYSLIKAWLLYQRLVIHTTMCTKKVFFKTKCIIIKIIFFLNNSCL